MPAMLRLDSNVSFKNKSPLEQLQLTTKNTITNDLKP